MSQDPPPPSPDPRRRLAGIGFVLLGAWFTWTSVELDAGVWLRVVLVALGVAVLGYGVAQLLQRPRRTRRPGP